MTGIAGVFGTVSESDVELIGCVEAGRVNDGGEGGCGDSD